MLFEVYVSLLSDNDNLFFITGISQSRILVLFTDIDNLSVLTKTHLLCAPQNILICFYRGEDGYI